MLNRQESEGLHEILFEIESARGMSDSCVDKETTEVNSQADVTVCVVLSLMVSHR